VRKQDSLPGFVPYVIAVTAMGALAWWGFLANTHSLPFGGATPLAMLVLAVITGMLELVPVALGPKTSFNAAYPLYMAALTNWGPLPAALLVLPELLVFALRKRGKALRPVVFNWAQHSVSLWVASRVFHLTGLGPRTFDLSSGLAALAATSLAFDLCNVLFVSTYVSLYISQPLARSFCDTFWTGRRGGLLAQHTLAIVASVMTHHHGLQGLLLVCLAIAGLRQLVHLPRQADRYRNASYTDAMTGLLNYRFFMQWQATAEMDRGSPFTLCLVDIDDLKSINDQVGHPTGDDAVRAVANTLVRCCRRSDHVIRYGGDEFLVILPATEPAEAEQVAHRCMQHLEAEVPQGIELSISMGLAGYPRDGLQVEAVLREADAALYRAKQRPGNSLCTA